MSRIAFVFPGQGSQTVGMGKDLYEEFEIAKEIYSAADDIMGMHLSAISFDGPAEILTQTHITQPALFVHSYILTRLIGDKIKAHTTAGHSLGEYTANVFAESISFEAGLKLVIKRGNLMKESGSIRPGTMAAIIGLDQNQIEEICNKASEHQIVQPANYNAPGQIVISGDVDAVRRAMKIAKEEPYKARMAKELQVSGAFHSELMVTSSEELRVTLDKTEFKNAAIPVFTNSDAEPVEDKDIIRNSLFRQLMSSVKWQGLTECMINEFNVSKFYEIGSGKVLTGLIKRINPDVEIHNIGTAEDLKNYNLI
ncbi:MAG: ACP S-malonyltransferase [Ignavibacteria bacterium]|nr:ACP S-malonyltransferase [Ignavibacteria bacterium]MBK9405373.1 ACP S-malonyltransferase [Ignavibacteria bacterium]